MTAVRAPKNVAQATALLERCAELDGELAKLEARRARMLARANAAIDARILPLIEERGAIAGKLEPWWAADGKALAKGDKSIQLGGCKIGTRAGQESLTHGFESDDKAAAALGDTRLRKQTTKEKLSLDKRATLKLLQAKGKVAEALAALGFRIQAAAEIFFIQRVEQAGTIGP